MQTIQSPMWIEHSKFQPTYHKVHKPFLKWAWSRHVIQFKFQDSQSHYVMNN